MSGGSTRVSQTPTDSSTSSRSRASNASSSPRSYSTASGSRWPYVVSICWTLVPIRRASANRLMPAAIENDAYGGRKAYGGRWSRPAALTAGVDSSRELVERVKLPLSKRDDAQRALLFAVRLCLAVREDAAHVDESSPVDVSPLERDPLFGPKP